jgi:hypothetical protein
MLITNKSQGHMICVVPKNAKVADCSKNGLKAVCLVNYRASLCMTMEA